MTPEIRRIDGPEPQTGLINRLVTALAEDSRILACWLHGSFGAGSMDQFSDIDMAIVVPDDQFYQGFQSARQIVCNAGECVIAWDSPKDVNGGGFTVFYADCNFLDVKVYRSSRIPFLSSSSPVRVMFDRDAAMQFSHEHRDEENLGAPLEEQVRWKMVFFWICVYSAVRFLKRESYWYAGGMINAVRGTMAQLLWLWTHPGETADMSFVVWGVVRRDLSPELLSELEDTVSDAERREMAGTLGRLIELFDRYGKRIAQDTGAEYPDRLVETVTDFYRRECA